MLRDARGDVLGCSDWSQWNMTRGDGVGEDEKDEASPQALVEVQRRLAEIQQRKRGRVRWRLSKHTAEMAIRALTDHASRSHRPSSKSRRRKRTKRLL